MALCLFLKLGRGGGSREGCEKGGTHGEMLCLFICMVWGIDTNHCNAVMIVLRCYEVYEMITTKH